MTEEQDLLAKIGQLAGKCDMYKTRVIVRPLTPPRPDQSA